jgi:hypothetical protein
MRARRSPDAPWWTVHFRSGSQVNLAVPLAIDPIRGYLLSAANPAHPPKQTPLAHGRNPRTSVSGRATTSPHPTAMNRYVKLFASLLTLTAGAVLQAAPDAKPALPAISIQEVKADDATTYAMWIARNNEVIKTKLGIDKSMRIYLGQAAGEDSGTIFVVNGADSFATMAKQAQATMDEPALVESRAHLNAVRELGPRTLLKAVRFDGRNDDGWLFNTKINANDEVGYLKALDQLRALFDSHGLQDIKINAFRVVAGRDTYTHLVSMNAASNERLSAFLDAIANEPWAAEWIAASGKLRTVVSNGTYREITR